MATDKATEALAELSIYIGIASKSEKHVSTCASLCHMKMGDEETTFEPVIAEQGWRPSFALDSLIDYLTRVKTTVPGGCQLYTTVCMNENYTVDGLTKWIKSWTRNGWKTRNGTPVKDKKRWQQAYELLNDVNATIHYGTDFGPHSDEVKWVERLNEKAREVIGVKALADSWEAYPNETPAIKNVQPKAPEPMLAGQGMW